MFEELFQESGLSIERLKTFCLIAQAGHITRAAGGDPTTQSLYSRQLKELEEFFGVELARRKGRGIVLTGAGERLNLVIREGFAGLCDFKNECKGQPLEISIAAGDSLIQWLLLPKLKTLTDALPKVKLRFHNLSTAKISEGVDDGLIDVALIRNDALKSNSKSVQLGVMKHSLFVPKTMKIAMNKSKPVAVLDGLPLATLEGRGVFKSELISAFKEQKLLLNIEVECSSFPLIAKTLSSGRIAAILPSIAAGEFQIDEMAEIPLDFLRRFDRKIVLTWNERVLRIRPVVEKTKVVLSKTLRF